MGWVETSLEGLWVFEPKIHGDHRGYFFESYNQKEAPDDINKINFVQDNESKSSYGVLRGLHYQLPPFSQSKLVRVVVGEVLDVAVDIRPDSKTYGQSFSIVLNETSKHQIFVPKGFAHGYVVLSEIAIFSYKCDGFYHPAAEAGIKYNDPTLDIDWKVPEAALILSARDLAWPDFSNHEPFLHD